MTEVRDQVSVDSHRDQLGLRAQHVNKLDAHRLDVEGRVLAQI